MLQTSNERAEDYNNNNKGLAIVFGPKTLVVDVSGTLKNSNLPFFSTKKDYEQMQRST